MTKIKPTHIGLDIALNIMHELQPETSVIITKSCLEIINAILIQSIGLQNAMLYRIADRILTLIPYRGEYLERIFRHRIQISLDTYLIHIIPNDNLCYCASLASMQSTVSASLIKIKCKKISPSDS